LLVVPFPWEGALTNQSSQAPATSAAPVDPLDPLSGPPLGPSAGPSADVVPAPVIPQANQSPATGPGKIVTRNEPQRVLLLPMRVIAKPPVLCMARSHTICTKSLHTREFLVPYPGFTA